MSFINFFLSGLTTTLLITITGQVSLAFAIIPRQPGATGRYQNLTRYSFSNGYQGRTFLDTSLWWDPSTWLDVRGGVTEITPGGTGGLLGALLPFMEQGWTFNRALKDLDGSFEILYYYSCSPLTNCGIEDFPNNYDQGGIGSHFHLKYYPKNNDPYGNSIHWIQRVVSSYTEESEQYPDDYIDIDPGQGNPYYDDGGTANTDYFIDTPYALDPSLDHYFTAELYLVEETAPKTVTIYNGIRWGWKNIVSPPPPSPPPRCPANATRDQFDIISYGGEPDWDEPGTTQENPFVASTTENGWQVFKNLPRCQ